MPDPIRLEFIIPKALWLTSNRQIANRGYRQRIVTNLHYLAAAAGRRLAVGPIDSQVHAYWDIRYPKGVRTDKGEASNAQPTTKALLDGLVDIGLLKDDGPKWVASETFQRGPNLDRPHDHVVLLTLTDHAREATP